MISQHPPELSLDELDRLVQSWLARLQTGETLSPEDYLAIGRLWNTLEADASLRSEPERARFHEHVIREMPTIARVLNMQPGRGYALSSKEHDFVLGGLLDERHRHRISGAGPRRK